MYDMHLHSQFSIDASYSMEDMTLEAIKKNIPGICFTDHIDLDATHKKIDLKFPISDYMKDYKKVKYKYSEDIKVFSGVEIGIQPYLYDRYDNIINDNSFDFIIMSLHAIDGYDVVRDNLFKLYSQRQILELYLKELLECVKGYKNYDVVGHLDFIDRYCQAQTGESFNNSLYDEYNHIVKEILLQIIKDGKGIELNTAGIRHGLDHLNPKISILKQYKELGGEIITLGSDAHSPKNIGDNFDIALKKLKSLDFKNIYYFKNRQAIPLSIK